MDEEKTLFKQESNRNLVFVYQWRWTNADFKLKNRSIVETETIEYFSFSFFICPKVGTHTIDLTKHSSQQQSNVLYLHAYT